MGIRIIEVYPGGLAWEIGLSPGDEIVAINDEPVEDYIDFVHVCGGVLETLEVLRGEERLIFELGVDEPLGIEVEEIRPRACRCRCRFCFMDQMPKGLRRSLYFKDDDYRLSYLYGNYITLTGLTERDWERIERYRLSPLYVSVHATDPQIRAFLMGCREAAHVMEGLRRLVDMGIEVHTQIVVCPGINDGEVLERSIRDLAGLYPGVRSVAVVPVGLTRYRQGLFPLYPVGRQEALKILETVLALGSKFLKRLGTRFVYPADELFIKARVPFPGPDFYEDFFQIEDGVGMVPLFLASVERVSRDLKGVLFITGVDFAPFLERSLHRAGVWGFEVVGVKNRFFGELVTVAGLLTGGDMVKAVEGRECRLVVVPEIVFNEDGLTLDDIDREELEKIMGKHVVPAPVEPGEFWRFLRSEM